MLAASFSKSWSLDFWKELTFDNYTYILFDYDVTQRAIRNSLLLATVAATFVVLAGSHHRLDRSAHPVSAGRKLLDTAALIPLGLPGIVIAVAMI